jgi:hypothetical protein
MKKHQKEDGPSPKGRSLFSLEEKWNQMLTDFESF